MDTEKVYLWDINDDEGLGVFRISQVLEPAMESDFIAFSKELVIQPGPSETEDEFIGRCMAEETGKYPQDQAYAICKSKWDNKDLNKQVKNSFNFSVDEEKMRVFGAILIPNKKFYRSDLDGYAMFSREAVEKARMTFKKNNNMFSVNVEHSKKGAPAYLLEDWIIEDSLEDKSYSKWNLKFEEGTWVGVMQITDKTYWNDYIKSGKVRGFSIELDVESVIQKKLLNMDKKKIEKLGEATLQDGTIIYWEGDTLDLGVAIFMDAELTQPAPDGEHVDSEGNVVVTRDGLVVEIRPVEEAPGEIVEESKEYALKSEMTSLIADLQSRIEKLESELAKKNEELSKEVKEIKSNTPGGKSFVFKKKEMEKENLSKETKVPFSQRLKKTYQELGKL